MINATLGTDRSATFSSKSREDNRALLLVLVTKLLAVALLLLPSPAPHLKTTNPDKEQHAQVQLTDKENTQPSKDFKEVVRASDSTEPKSRRNATLSGTRAAQVTQNVVRIQIGDLTEDEERQTSVHKSHVGGGTGSSRVRSEDPVGDVETGQHPVVGAVLDDVAGGHGGAAEAVHEDCLVLALQEVQGQQAADEELYVGEGGESGERLVEGEVQQRSEGEEEEGWDQEGAEVFDDEDGAPGDLGSCGVEEVYVSLLVSLVAFGGGVAIRIVLKVGWEGHAPRSLT
jgi:hypothetical protein